MKIKKIIIILTLVLSPLVFLSSKAFAVNFPTISTACESKNGELTAFADGFSFLQKCQGNSRRVVLIGEQGIQGLKGDKGDKGDPSSPATSGNLKVFDANDNELGILVDYDTFLYTPLNKFIHVNLETGRLSPYDVINSPGTIGSAFYTTSNCTGTVYLVGGNVASSLRNGTLYPENNGKYYIVDTSIPMISAGTTSGSVFDSLGVCSVNGVGVFNAYTL